MVVLDTNVTLDWMVFRDRRVDHVVRAVQEGRLRWVSCAWARRELAQMLSHRSLASWSPDVDLCLSLHDRHAQLQPDPVPRGAPSPRCTDPNDQVFVDLALSTHARWLLTHDRALLRMARRLQRHDIEVLRPQAWDSPPAR